MNILAAIIIPKQGGPFEYTLFGSEPDADDGKLRRLAITINNHPYSEIKSIGRQIIDCDSTQPLTSTAIQLLTSAGFDPSEFDPAIQEPNNG